MGESQKRSNRAWIEGKRVHNAQETDIDYEYLEIRAVVTVDYSCAATSYITFNKRKIKQRETQIME